MATNFNNTKVTIYYIGDTGLSAYAEMKRSSLFENDALRHILCLPNMSGLIIDDKNVSVAILPRGIPPIHYNREIATDTDLDDAEYTNVADQIEGGYNIIVGTLSDTFSRTAFESVTSELLKRSIVPIVITDIRTYSKDAIDNATIATSQLSDHAGKFGINIPINIYLNTLDNKCAGINLFEKLGVLVGSITSPFEFGFNGDELCYVLFSHRVLEDIGSLVSFSCEPNSSIDSDTPRYYRTVAIAYCDATLCGTGIPPLATYVATGKISNTSSFAETGFTLATETLHVSEIISSLNESLSKHIELAGEPAIAVNPR